MSAVNNMLHSTSLNHENIHSNCEWNWYEHTVLNISNYVTLCGPPDGDKDETNYKLNGYSLIQCVYNPTFDPNVKELSHKLSNHLMWKLVDWDIRNVSRYKKCKLSNVFIINK